MAGFYERQLQAGCCAYLEILVVREQQASKRIRKGQSNSRSLQNHSLLPHRGLFPAETPWVTTLTHLRVLNLGTICCSWLWEGNTILQAYVSCAGRSVTKWTPTWNHIPSGGLPWTDADTMPWSQQGLLPLTILSALLCVHFHCWSTPIFQHY